MNKRKQINFLFISCVFHLLYCGCSNDTNIEKNKNPEEYTRYQFDQINTPNKLRLWELDEYEHTPVWEIAKCIYEQDTIRLDELCKANPTLVNYQFSDSTVISLLDWCVSNDRYFSARVLLKNGANPNDKPPNEGRPLTKALFYRHSPRFLQLLLDYKVDVNPKVLISPLQYAVVLNDTYMKMLVEAGADVNYGSDNLNTALSYAISDGKFNSALYLISKGANFRHGLMDSSKNYKQYFIDYLKLKAFYDKGRDTVRDSLLQFLRQNGADSSPKIRWDASRKGVGDTLLMRSIK